MAAVVAFLMLTLLGIGGLWIRQTAIEKDLATIKSEMREDHIWVVDLKATLRATETEPQEDSEDAPRRRE